MIEPTLIDGAEYYVSYAHPTTVRAITLLQAVELIKQQNAGRDWRRIKREMRKAGLPKDAAKLIASR